MKIGIIGSGGREHALCYKLGLSPQVKKFIVFQATLEQEI